MTLEKQTITIDSLEKRYTKAKGDEYTAYKTNAGSMTCFIAEVNKELGSKIKIPVEVSIELSADGRFKNIRAYHGVSPEWKGVLNNPTHPANEDINAGIEVIDMKKSKATNGNGSMYASYAKDVFVSLWAMPIDKEALVAGKDVMDAAIALVKQAKEAFE